MVDKVCEICRRAFSVKKSKSERGEGRFCSWDCRRKINPVDRFWARVNSSHLFAGTNADNVRDRDVKNRHTRVSGDRNGSRARPDRLVRGESNHKSKLTAGIVLDIRSSNETQVELAGRYGVSQPSISAVILRKNWAHV